MGIYMDNAATTMQKPDCVIDAVVNAMRHMGNSGRGAHEASLDASRLIYETREMLSELFNLGDPRQVAFTLNSTEALNTAILGLFDPGDHIISTVMEHNSVLRPLYRLEEKGCQVSFVPCDEKGRLRTDLLESFLKENTKALVCTHASNLTGNANDLMYLGRFCKDHGLLFVVDASQTAGVLPIDMQAMNIDVVCFTGHKGLYGPQGTGVLLCSTQAPVRPLMEGGTGSLSIQQEMPDFLPDRLEAGTANVPGIAGLLEGLRFVEKQGVQSIGSACWPGRQLWGSPSFRKSMYTPVRTWPIRQALSPLRQKAGCSGRIGSQYYLAVHKSRAYLPYAPLHLFLCSP